MSRWYGNIMNRLEENHDRVGEITVGTGMTEYSWSDRHAYEVVAVRDQKHVSVRELGHKHVGEAFSNDWELFPDETKPVRDMVKRGKYWYWTSTVTIDDLPEEPGTDFGSGIDNHQYGEQMIRLMVAGFDPEVIRAKGKQTKMYRANVSFGVADYFYDYEF